jgi:hypothetical protein
MQRPGSPGLSSGASATVYGLPRARDHAVVRARLQTQQCTSRRASRSGTDGRARGRGEIDRRIRSRAHQGVSDALASDEHGAPAGADTLVIDVDTVAEARLTRRFRLCKRTLTLLDGRRLRWRWLSSAVSGRYEDAAPALERCLGERLHGR